VVVVDGQVSLGQHREDVGRRLEQQNFQRSKMASEELFYSQELAQDLRCKYNDRGTLEKAKGDFTVLNVGRIKLSSGATIDEVRQLLGEPTKITRVGHGVENHYYDQFRLHLIFSRQKASRFVLGAED